MYEGIIRLLQQIWANSRQAMSFEFNKVKFTLSEENYELKITLENNGKSVDLFLRNSDLSFSDEQILYSIALAIKEEFGIKFKQLRYFDNEPKSKIKSRFAEGEYMKKALISEDAQKVMLQKQCAYEDIPHWSIRDWDLEDKNKALGAPTIYETYRGRYVVLPNGLSEFFHKETPTVNVNCLVDCDECKAKNMSAPDRNGEKQYIPPQRPVEVRRVPAGASNLSNLLKGRKPKLPKGE